MSRQRAAAIALLAGFGLVVLSFFAGPSGVSEASSVESARQAIRDQQGLYVVASFISGLTILLPPVGFLLLALDLRGQQNPWPASLGAGLFLIGALLVEIHIVRITIEPRPYLDAIIERGDPPVLFPAYVFVSLAAAFLFGIALLQSSLPKWLGYLMAGYAAISAVVVLVTGIPVYGAWLLFKLVELVVGIVLLRQPVPRGAWARSRLEHEPSVLEA